MAEPDGGADFSWCARVRGKVGRDGAIRASSGDSGLDQVGGYYFRDGASGGLDFTCDASVSSKRIDGPSTEIPE